MKKFWTEFKAFISRGNVMNLAVGVIVGGAFSAIVTALTNNIIRPFINWILKAITGGDGLSSIVTFLGDPVYVNGEIDMTNSIYIDWGAFITAIIDFLIIAFTIFVIMKLLMGAQGFIQKSIKEYPTRAERKQLKKEGLYTKDRDKLIKATADLRERNKPAPKELPPTQEELLTQILAELKKQNEVKVEQEVVNEVAVEEKPKKKKTAKAK